MQKTALFLSTIVLATSASALSSNMIDYNGYLRSGTGSTMSGSAPMQSFTLPEGLPMGRLGNENTTYGDLEMRFHLAPKEKKEIWDMKLRFEYNPTVSNVEAYTQLGNWNDSPVVYWAGKRLYRENDIHITDDWQFNMSGTGAGVEKIPFVVGNLNLAYIKQNDNSFIDLRIRDINLPVLGSTFIWAAYGDGHATSSTSSTNGAAAGIQFNQKWGSDITNQLTIRAGNGIMADLHAWGKAANDKAEDAYTLRISDQTLMKLADNLELGTVIYFENRNYTKVAGSIVDSGKQESLYAFTARPIYYFTDHYSLAMEGTYGAREDQNLTRLTIAPQIHPTSSFWSRPSIRAFYTHNFWSGISANNLPAGFNNKTDGGQYGVQAEVFF